jgi:flagellar hook-basal body complex protein FliE
MSNPIGPFVPIQPIAPIENNGVSAGERLGNKGEESFSTFLNEALDKLNNTQLEAEQASMALATGQSEDFHTPVIAMEKASLTLGLAVTVRNKVLDAYHEIMRMQI